MPARHHDTEKTLSLRARSCHLHVLMQVIGVDPSTGVLICEQDLFVPNASLQVRRACICRTGSLYLRCVQIVLVVGPSEIARLPITPKYMTKPGCILAPMPSPAKAPKGHGLLSRCSVFLRMQSTSRRSVTFNVTELDLSSERTACLCRSCPSFLVLALLP